MAICRRYAFGWQPLFAAASARAVLSLEDLVYRCREFPVDALNSVPFIQPRDRDRDVRDWATVAVDIENLGPNRLAPPDAEPLFTAS